MLAACSPAVELASAAAPSPQRVIQNKGSDTLVNLALAWAEAYRQVNPDLLIAVTGGGSGTGIASLINRTVDIANVSRHIKEEEIDAAHANGVEPTEFIVAIDALAIVVNLANPVSELTIDQLSAIFTGQIDNWKELGGNDAIILLSRETNSGTHVYFLEEVVRRAIRLKAIFRRRRFSCPQWASRAGRHRPNAIGYDGLGYVDPAHEKPKPWRRMPARLMSCLRLPPAWTAAIRSRPLYMYTAGQPPTP